MYMHRAPTREISNDLPIVFDKKDHLLWETIHVLHRNYFVEILVQLDSSLKDSFEVECIGSLLLRTNPCSSMEKLFSIFLQSYDYTSLIIFRIICFSHLVLRVNFFSREGRLVKRSLEMKSKRTIEASGKDVDRFELVFRGYR